MVSFLKIVFLPHLLGFFCPKIRKDSKLEIIRKYDEETEYFEKTLYLSKSHLYQNVKAQYMPVVVGRPV